MAGHPSILQTRSLRLQHLVALASSAIQTDPGSAKALLQQAAALIGVPEGEPVTDKADTRTQALAAWQIRRIDQHIESNIGSPIRNSDLARVTRLSVSYFSRTFRLTTGQSPHAYVVDQRVRRAKALMARSDDELSQVACACGFADQAHFSRIFRQRVGETPSSWRRARQTNRDLHSGLTTRHQSQAWREPVTGATDCQHIQGFQIRGEVTR